VSHPEAHARAADRRDTLAGRDFGQASRISPALQSPATSDDELPDAADIFSAAVAAKAKRERASNLQLIKQRALEAAQRRSEKGKASTRRSALSDDSDLEIERDLSPAPAAARTPAAMLARSRASDARANHRGSPGAPSSDPPGSDDWVTDSQLRAAGRTFGAAAALAAGHASPVSAHRRARAHEQGRQVDGVPESIEGSEAPRAVTSRRSNPPLAVTQHQLNETMLRRAQQQNLRSRTAKEATSKGATQPQKVEKGVESAPVSYAEQVRRMLERSSARKQLVEEQQSGVAAADDDDDDDPDWDESADMVVDDVVLLGSGSEAEAVESADGDASDASEDVDVRRSAAIVAADSEEEDSDKENSQPTSSQPCAPLRSADDDEDETVFAPLPRGRGTRLVLSDDEADAESSVSTVRTPFAALPADSPGRGRKSASSADAITMAPSANFEGGMTQWFQPTAAAQPHAASSAPRQASVSPNISRAGSFVLGGGGFTQLFQPTAAPAVRRPSSPSPQGASSLLAPSAGAASNASVFGQFFESTQVGAPPRGESLDIIGRLQVESQSMPPPTTTGDAFAALRRAQADEAAAPTASALPSLSYSESDAAHLDAQAERARAEQQLAANKAPMQYINRHGFFTQTRPGDDDSGQSQSQSQSQSQAALWDATQAPEGSRLSAPESAAAGASGESIQDQSSAAGPAVSAPSRKRFRRARQESDDDEEPATRPSGSGSARASRSPSARAAQSPQADELGSDEEAEDLDEEEEDLQLGSQDSLPKDAFTVLREAASRRSAGPETKKRTNAFVEGEAEESDEDNEGRVRRGNGGLQGIFSDDGESGNEDDEDEEDDGKDLEGLMNDEKEEDEALKDRLALARYQEDIDKDDAAALALHEKAVRGGLRTGRRGRARDAGDLGDVLDDDWDEEDLLRRAQGLRAPLAKKRKLEGTDGMDLLGESDAWSASCPTDAPGRTAQSEESQAFVRTYVETHRNEDELDQYAFLAGGEEEASEDEEVRTRAPRHDSDEASDNDDLDDDGPQRERITHRDLVRQIREQRRKRKSGAVLDEDDEAALAAQQAEAEAQRRADPFYDSDEEMSSLHAPVINDRLAAKARSMRDGPSDGSRMAFERRGPGAGGDDDEEESQVSTFGHRCAGPADHSGTVRHVHAAAARAAARHADGAGTHAPPAIRVEGGACLGPGARQRRCAPRRRRCQLERHQLWRSARCPQRRVQAGRLDTRAGPGCARSRPHAQERQREPARGPRHRHEAQRACRGVAVTGCAPPPLFCSLAHNMYTYSPCIPAIPTASRARHASTKAAIAWRAVPVCGSKKVGMRHEQCGAPWTSSSGSTCCGCQRASASCRARCAG
jgi:hypothetical protein